MTYFQSVLTYIRSVLTYIWSVLTYIRPVLTYLRSVLTYIRSLLTYIRSVLTYTRSVLTCSNLPKFCRMKEKHDNQRRRLTMIQVQAQDKNAADRPRKQIRNNSGHCRSGSSLFKTLIVTIATPKTRLPVRETGSHHMRQRHEEGRKWLCPRFADDSVHCAQVHRLQWHLRMIGMSCMKLVPLAQNSRTLRVFIFFGWQQVEPEQNPPQRRCFTWSLVVHDVFSST